MSDSSRLGLLLSSSVGNDHCTVDPDLHLRTLNLPDPDTLHEPECIGEPRHGHPNIRVHEHGMTVVVGIERLFSTKGTLDPISSSGAGLPTVTSVTTAT